jgi:hypothetical protein
MENSIEFTNSQVNVLADSMDLDVVNLQNNTFPKGCVPLEHLFDRHDVYKGKIPKKQIDEALEFNIGTEIVRQHRYSNRGRTSSITTHTTRSKINTSMF